MTNITTFSQSGLDLTALHDAMLDAFSDYVLPLQPDYAQFEFTLHCRGFDPDASFVALDGQDIKAFWNVANRGARRYLISSGTCFGHRGRGLSGRLGEAAIAAAESSGAETFWLEVIRGNTAAERLYGKLGFEEIRKLDCYTLDHPDPTLKNCRLADRASVCSAIDKYKNWRPSWQNSNDSLESMPLEFLLHDEGGAILGAGGILHQLAAIDRFALSEILGAAGTFGALKLINLDSGDSVLRNLLQELGADCFIRQSEMCRTLPISY